LKFLKLLGVPLMAVGMLTLMTAGAYANHATIVAKLDCTSQTKVCFDLTVTTTDFPAQGGRDITVTLLGHKKGDAADKVTQIGQPQTVHLDKDLTDKKLPPVCFEDVKTTDFDSFSLEIKPDNAADFTVNGKAKVVLGPFDNVCPTPTPTPTATPSATASPSASPSANTTVVLANTGGFDYRFPLIGLVILVAGAALFVVSASRGRSTSER